jgi:hypothetical protein
MVRLISSSLQINNTTIKKYYVNEYDLNLDTNIIDILKSNTNVNQICQVDCSFQSSGFIIYSIIERTTDQQGTTQDNTIIKNISYELDTTKNSLTACFIAKNPPSNDLKYKLRVSTETQNTTNNISCSIPIDFVISSEKTNLEL